jgi:hypothetical protein
MTLRTQLLRRAAFCAVSLTPAGALAGNADSFYLSGDAALQAGAVTADARGGGAIWYNPAGLGQLPALRLDVSINAFSLRLGGLPDFDAGGGARVTRLATINFNIVPSGLTLTRRFGTVGLGLGVFVPEQHQTFLRTQVTSPASAERPGATFGVDLYERVQQYAIGPGFGVALSPRVDFGAALLVTYRNQLSIAGVDLGSGDGSSAGSLLSHETLDWQQFGAQLVLGTQLHLGRGYELGLTLRSPGLILGELRHHVVQQTEAAGGAAGTTHRSDFQQRFGFATALVAPLRIHVGLSRTLGKLRLAADGSYQAPLRNESLALDWAPTFNGRLGVQHTFTKTFALGGGVFTDRSPVRALRSFGDSSLDFYGVTMAVDMGTAYRVLPYGATQPIEGSLRFGTTVALSYAVGLGQVVRGSVAGDQLLPISQSSRSVAHEISLHLASSLGQ